MRRARRDAVRSERGLSNNHMLGYGSISADKTTLHDRAPEVY